jgi:hypothetical protein
VELYFHPPVRLHGVVWCLARHRDNFTLTLPYLKDGTKTVTKENMNKVTGAKEGRKERKKESIKNENRRKELTSECCKLNS